MKWRVTKVAPRHTARAIVVHNGNILLMERWRPGLHYFSIPGGGIEAGETPEITAARELMEETGCVIVPERLLYLLTFADGSDHHIFLGRYVSGTPHLPADAPEALDSDPDNRFKPCWVPFADVAKLPLRMWQPIHEQLVHDLAQGFSPDVITLAG